VNPLLIHGQSHGGIAQGIGQALWEACVYDARSGQLLSSSFLDYAMPRADLLPAFETEISEVPSTTNPEEPFLVTGWMRSRKNRFSR
jgi:aerobic carbon-monoxide dehydrogenase large subunit